MQMNQVLASRSSVPGNIHNLCEYLSRYPQYADMIADFVTYYHAMEVEIPQEAEIIPSLSQTSRAALEKAWNNVLHADFEEYHSLHSLQMAANNVHKSFLQLALEIGLSQDILQKLDLHCIDATTIPREICHRLARAFRTTHSSNRNVSWKCRVIEDQPNLDVQVYSFQEALAQSKNMSDEQKGVWHTILEHEGLL